MQWLAAAINCRSRSRLYYKSLTPPPARRKAANPIFSGERGRCPRAAARIRGIQAFGENLMSDRPNDLSSFPSYREPRRSLLSARKFALMASVVAGLGVAVYGF